MVSKQQLLLKTDIKKKFEKPTFGLIVCHLVPNLAFYEVLHLKLLRI